MFNGVFHKLANWSKAASRDIASVAANKIIKEALEHIKMVGFITTPANVKTRIYICIFIIITI